MRFFLAVFLFVFSLVYSAPVEARVIVIRRSIPITYPVSTFGLSCDPGLSSGYGLSGGYELSRSFGYEQSNDCTSGVGLYGVNSGVGLYGVNSGEIIRERKIRRPRPRPRPTLIIRGRDVFVP